MVLSLVPLLEGNCFKAAEVSRERPMTCRVCRIQGETMEGAISATSLGKRLAWRRRAVLSLLTVKRVQICYTWYDVKQGNIRKIILRTIQTASFNLVQAKFMRFMGGAELGVQNYFNVDFKHMLRVSPRVGCGSKRHFPVCSRLYQSEEV